MKKICSSIIIISIVLWIGLKSYEEVEYELNKKHLDIIFKNRILDSNYIGYIEIKRLSIKKEIVLGIDQKNLDNNHVALSIDSNSLNSDHVVLAGHSIRPVFLNLHKALVGDEIEIHTYYNKELYEIYDIQIVDKTNVNFINDGNLVLITCMNDNNKRLIIKAKKK